jgi:hypothetical protein
MTRGDLKPDKEASTHSVLREAHHPKLLSRTLPTARTTSSKRKDPGEFSEMTMMSEGQTLPDFSSDLRMRDPSA